MITGEIAPAHVGHIGINPYIGSRDGENRPFLSFARSIANINFSWLI